MWFTWHCYSKASATVSCLHHSKYELWMHLFCGDFPYWDFHLRSHTHTENHLNSYLRLAPQYWGIHPSHMRCQSPRLRDLSMEKGCGVIVFGDCLNIYLNFSLWFLGHWFLGQISWECLRSLQYVRLNMLHILCEHAWDCSPRHCSRKNT